MPGTRKRSPDGFMHASWYYAACAWCGQRVVHCSTGKPLHMHRWSKKCQAAGKALRGST